MNELVLSVFPGIDLLGRAFEESGYCIVRGPDLVWGGDIRTFHPPAGVFEGVIGGPPCPEFSPLRYLIAANGYASKHGNLIPEFERVVAEAQPDWFLMEEGPLAPDAHVPGYAAYGFFLCPTWLGEEQSRKRKLCFGVKGTEAVDLRRWIDYAVFEPLVAAGTVYSTPVNNSDEAKGRVNVPAVTHHANPYPVAMKGSGKPKPRTAPARSWAESCRLQGCPPDFLDGSPFTVTGKRQLLGNGVPMQMGRALAQAIRRGLHARSGR